MNNGPLIILLIVILIMAGVGFYIYTSSSKGSSSSTPSSSTSSGSSSEPDPEPNPIITAESSAPPSCTLSPNISGTSLTYYLVQGADTDISSGASVTYDPSSNPRLLTLTNSGGKASGGQITIRDACGDINRITGILTLRQNDYSLTIIPGSLLYINQYAFNVDRYASNTPPPPSYGGSGGIPGYTRKGASGDVQGFDITGPSIQVITPQACAKACDDIDSCLGFSIDLNNTVCNLKAAEYNGTTNINQAQTVSYYSKDKNTLPKRYFVLYNSGTDKWLSVSVNDNYFVNDGSRITLTGSSSIYAQHIWWYNSSSSQFVSAISPNCILSYNTNGDMSIQPTSATGMSSSMYYSTTKGGGTNQIKTQDGKILTSNGSDVQIRSGVIGNPTKWELIYLPVPITTSSLPTDWNVVFLLRTRDRISSRNNQYGYVCAPLNAFSLTGSASVKSICIYDSDNPYGNVGAIWSCWTYTDVHWSSIYIRKNTKICLRCYNGNEGQQVDVIGTDEECNKRGQDFSGTGFSYTSEGYISCQGAFMKVDTGNNMFVLTKDRSLATPMVCIQINPTGSSVLNNYKTNEPEIF
jgi:hypothetical protein